MKKILLAAIFLTACGITSFAQLQKGSKMLGMSLANVTGGINGLYNGFTMSIHPTAGVFVKDKLVVGGSVLLGLSTGSNFLSYNYGAGIFSRKYFSKGADSKIAYFIGADVSVTGVSQHIENGVENGYALFGTVGCGMAYFILPSVSLEAKLGLQAASWNDINRLVMQPAANLGFQIYLPKKQDKQ